jgi:uncharacterized protein (TIGR02391 family)
LVVPGLIDYLPNAAALLELEPEDLGAILLNIVHQDRSPRFAFSNIEMPLWNANSPAYPYQKRQEVGRALAESWLWLQSEGLIMSDPDQPNGWYCLTRRGQRLRTSVDLEAYRYGNLLPTATLHPSLVEQVRPMFLRGDYDIAVVQAFKAVEVAVRGAALLPADMVGIDLMRTAFHQTSGPLTDMTVIEAERQALSHLFAGAIGHAKNPGSHRTVVIGRAEAAQLISFASYLLGIVETRANAVRRP